MKTLFTLIAFVLSCYTLLAQTISNMKESELVLNTSTGNIHGTLSIPNAAEKTPVIIIVPGSGSTDRDGNIPPVVQARPYKMLAQECANKGISTLRYDKRGAGKSKGAVLTENELRFETYVDDVIGWIKILKADDRFSKVIVLGHSEGSLVGMIAANKTNTDGYISLAGCGKPADQMLRDQLKVLPPNLLIELGTVLDKLKQGETTPNVNSNLYQFIRPSVQPYLMSWMKYDPAVELKKLHIPVLILQGTTDIQVTVDHAKMLSEALPKAKLVIIDNMNHVLKEAPANRQANLATYGNPALPIKPELSNSIVEFVKSK
ncbi:alpha/beta fold hydrolase [Puteibacter caeruleilacunae]|nr:alpha/beta fold hydrolase [Puteibacter caeruleilacunae]